MEEDGETDGKRRTAVTYDEKMSSHFHSWKEDFTEKPERFTETIKRCQKYHLLERCKYIPSRMATEEEMQLCHSKELIEILRKSQYLSMEEMRKLSRQYDYLYFHKDIYDNARLAMGSTLDLVGEVIEGKVQNGFAIVRPPGHHAMYNEFNGYCYLNNVAVAATMATTKYGLERVVIFDWDVHHGQGLQYCFYDNPKVLYISIHKYLDGKEWPYLRESDYDHVGKGAGLGFNVNIPINKIACGNSDYMAVFHQIILPIIYEYNPELILVSAGYDAALGCPEGEMEVTPACFSHFVNLLLPLAGGKLCLVLEGGYCIETLAEGVALSLKTLLGDPCQTLEPLGKPDIRTKESILNVIKTVRPHWKCLQFQGELSDSVVSEFKGVWDWPPQIDVKFYTNARPRTFSLSQECFNPEYLDAEEELRLRVAELIQRPLLPAAPNKVCIGYAEQSLLHKDISSSGFEECPERIVHICKTLKNKGLWDRCLITPGRKATEEDLTLAHSSAFIKQLKKTEKMEDDVLIKYKSTFHSVYLCQDSFESASWSVGTLLSTVDSVMTGESESGVAVIRPPGHHAEANTTMGFCIFNNVGIAAKYAQQKYNVERPPGHHTEANTTMGFCIFNNVGIAAKYAQQKYNVERPPGHHTEAYTTMGFCIFNNVEIAAKYAQQKYNVERPPVHHAEANTTMGFCIFNNVGIAAEYAQQKYNVQRPPGHHAEANTTMGFCIFNNVGIAAKYAQQKYNVERILIVDWDIHHGNALQTLFYNDPSVLNISLHRFDQGSFYPFGGEGYHKCVGGKSAQGYNVNIAWNEGSKGDADYIAAFQQIVLPITYEFCPDLVLVAAGFDAAEGDVLGNYRLSPAVFGHMTCMLKSFANGKVILALEGGYNLDQTSNSLSCCVSTLLGDTVPTLPSMVPSQSAVKNICDTIDMQSQFWKSLSYRVDLPTTKQLEIIKEQKENMMREESDDENSDSD